MFFSLLFLHKLLQHTVQNGTSTPISLTHNLTHRQSKLLFMEASATTTKVHSYHPWNRSLKSDLPFTLFCIFWIRHQRKNNMFDNPQVAKTFNNNVSISWKRITVVEFHNSTNSLGFCDVSSRKDYERPLLVIKRKRSNLILLHTINDGRDQSKKSQKAITKVKMRASERELRGPRMRRFALGVCDQSWRQTIIMIKGPRIRSKVGPTSLTQF